MHPDELAIEIELVRELVETQFPGLADRQMWIPSSTGTVNIIARLGDDLYARLPRRRGWERDLERELRWLPALAPRLTLMVPEPVAEGRPTTRYPLPWAIYRWIEGEPHAVSPAADEEQAAADLASFVAALREVDLAAEAPRAGRRPLGELDAQTREAIHASAGVIDASEALKAWDQALASTAWDGERRWIHADLLPTNLLVRDGRITAVIDWGAAGVGDPAMDVIPAWSVFGARGRAMFRDALAVDDDTWARARGIALHQAALIVPYYTESNPTFVEMARRTIAQVIADTSTQRLPPRLIEDELSR